MYFDIDYNELRTALENEAMACELAINTGGGLRAFTVTMPLKQRIMLSFEFLCAAASISDDERFMLFADGVKDLALELSEGMFSVSETTLEAVKSGESASESDILQTLKDPVARELFMNRSTQENQTIEEPDELNPELSAAFGLRWGLGRVLDKAFSLVENNRDDVERAYARSQRVRLAFRRGGIDLQNFCQARINEIENVIDVFSGPYDEVDEAIVARMEEMENQKRKDGQAPI